ncbi:TauD/TfdA family dioxygenase [Hwanghaeella grinnelliae]|uniref:TauD/TfdA family dioxygenase n=1 Tax=Hwanghaeella grinnelliae TaxID=2500179 RepID=A0A437QUE7_9PROT|nr:TauD/TfdA family dioxygenase [Hwanghaeella grinnelliae]RVU38131.1 TauD/TfdA family dioxygenase [Hwanghaeella grinnelliae]
MQGVPLNGEFGCLIEDVRLSDLSDPDFRQQAFSLWQKHGGLLALRGDELTGLTADGMLNWAEVFGAIEVRPIAGRDLMMVDGTQILRIGNIRDEQGRAIAQQSDVPALKNDADMRYDTTTHRPVWHTDIGSATPTIGSVLHCRQTPPSGGETLFADAGTAFERLDAATREKLLGMEAVMSQAHHDKKISLYTPGYPVLTPEERAANPPYRQPVVLIHPETGKPALYGLNSSTAALVPKGATISQEQLDLWDLEGVEDESVALYRNLLPFVTGPEFTVKWSWSPGDIVVWDNRCTLHAATGFDSDAHQREMWRVTLHAMENVKEEAA